MLKSLSLKNDFNPLLKLAIPLVLTGLMQSSLSFFETVFLAQLGEQVMAAGALVAWLFATLIVILFGTFSSVNILVAHKHGANDINGISLVIRDGLLLALILTIPTFLLFWNMAPIFLLVGQKPELVVLADAYLHGLAWGLLPKFIIIVLFEFIVGLGHTRVVMVFTLLSIPLYILFSYILIFGKFGFPELQIAGAGWGMTAGDWVTSIALSIYVLWSKNYRQYIASVFNFRKPSYLLEILQLGAPMGVMYCIEVGFFFAVTLMMGLIGVQALAANQVAMQYLGPLIGVVFCIAQAVTVRMGHQIGAKQVEAAERTGFAGIILSALFMMLIALFYIFTPELLISADFNVNDPQIAETIHFAKQFLFVAAFYQILEAIRITIFGALRGLKDTQYSLVVSVFSFWGIALPCGYFIVNYLNTGGVGFWLGMISGVCFSIVMMLLRFKRKIRSYGKV